MPHILGYDFSRVELERRVGDLSQVFGVDLAELRDGLERGIRILRFRSGSGLEFQVLVDRAFDIADMTFRGIPIGWKSAAGFRSPWLHEMSAEGGFSWFRSFSGLMTSCGLDHVHAPETDSAAHFHQPDKETIFHPLHGRIGNTPARLKGYGVRWENDRCFLYADGEVSQAAVFAENLLLERRIEIEVGANTVSVRDRVSNLGFHPTPHAYLWHVNLGWPVVSEGARLVAPIENTAWSLRANEADERGARIQSAPRSPATPQVFDHRLKIEADGTARAALVNDSFVTDSGVGGLAVEIAYDGHAMPSLFQWQYFQAGNYVVAIEPCTVHAGSRAVWHERGEFRVLQHGDHIDYWLDITPHQGESAIKKLERRVIGS